MFGFLVAGHDTTSTTLEWALKYLTNHQNVQQKLRQTLRAYFTDAATANRNPSAREIAKAQIPYLDAFVEETLRCATTTNGVMRVTKADTEVLGYRIPRGTDILFMINGPSFMAAPFPVDEKLRSGNSRDAKAKTGTWEVHDMDVFKPERWLVNQEFDSRAGPSLPFGLGPRGCFGKCCCCCCCCCCRYSAFSHIARFFSPCSFLMIPRPQAESSPNSRCAWSSRSSSGTFNSSPRRQSSAVTGPCRE